jgi:hypothetical protein
MRPSVRRVGALGAVLLLGAGGGAAAGALLDDAATNTTVVERGSSTASNSGDAASVNDIYRSAAQSVVEIKTSAAGRGGGPFGIPGGEEAR